MRIALSIAVLAVLVGCGGRELAPPARDVTPAPAARLPSAPGTFAPSLVAIRGRFDDPELTAGAMLSDVDSCASCHPDVAAQWSASAHSFASFGNPIYRANIERQRAELGKRESRHCGGCHDMPLMVDGLMTVDAPIPPADLRSHSGVTCRLCHGIDSTSHDGNGSYTWNAAPLDAPALDDAASIERHRTQVTTKLDTELCVACHRGFLSPDMKIPVHLSGIDEPGMWRSSGYTGNGIARLDSVERKTCIDCHMERVAASTGELGAKHGSVASHRFVGGHTWMAAMRDDREQLHLTQARLEGAASIDIAGARVVEPGKPARWILPADGAPVVAGTTLELDVVIRNLLVGHRFPGGVLDIQDTWVEVEVTDRHGRRLASSGLAHATDPRDTDTHVLRTLVVDEHGQVLEEHEMARFRTQIATQTLAPREAQAVRYAFTVGKLDASRLPLVVTARLRHRSRTLAMQAATCSAARTPEGEAFLAGARGAREVSLDPCRPQPITLVAETRIELGTGAHATTARPAWERVYEHGMALAASIVTRLDEARAVLDAALAAAPDDRARAMVNVQLAWVASRQNRLDDALALVRDVRRTLGTNPPVLDAIVADAYVRMNRWADAVAPAKACTERAPGSVAAWSVYARSLVAVGEYARALDACTRGLELAPRDPDLLRAQATALAALHDPRAEAAQAAYVRFRAPDDAAALRIACSKQSERCARERNPVKTLVLRPR
ncbi:MAG TPA: multiheme c-type cytochrome [Kofleriaceae bacterium]|nr:multiheme c-type cytochrome [Kofleriaceae bacterium]